MPVPPAIFKSAVVIVPDFAIDPAIMVPVVHSAVIAVPGIPAIPVTIVISHVLTQRLG
jgi:hypothetical protein